MVTLKAYHPYEGAGVLEDAGRLVYIDFPYSTENEYECSQEELDGLVLRMNFEEADLQFDDGKAAIAFLRSKANEGEDPLANETEETILESYNCYGIDELSDIVDSIVELYVETKDFVRAIRGLERIANLRIVKESKDFQIKVLRLLNDCRKEIGGVVFEIKRKRIEGSESGTENAVEEKFGTLNGNSKATLGMMKNVWDNLVA
jgi:hypothetical protein